MTAIACLRVAVDADRTGLAPSVLGPLVSKFSSAYMETRWLWPRLFESLDHYTFLLTDPRADEMDPAELARLADELQIKLFGEREAGDVALLLFEGPPEVVTAFVALGPEETAAAIADQSRLPPGGRLTRILPSAAGDGKPAAANRKASGPQWRSLETGAGEVKTLTIQLEMPQLDGLQGIYFTVRELFVADVVTSTPGRARSHFSLVEGAAHMPPEPLAFDADCIAAGVRVLEQQQVSAMLYFPICYSNLLHSSTRTAYEALFETLPQERRNQLAAAVYDVPRDPAFGGLSQVKATLERYFTNIDLRTSDPAFQVEKLPQKAVTSVTLTLPDTESRQRLAVLRRFAERIGLYKSKQIWPAVTNVRSQAELTACASLGVPFVTGPAVCRMQTAPVGGRMQPIGGLPVLAA